MGSHVSTVDQHTRRTCGPVVNTTTRRVSESVAAVKNIEPGKHLDRMYSFSISRTVPDMLPHEKQALERRNTLRSNELAGMDPSSGHDTAAFDTAATDTNTSVPRSKMQPPKSYDHLKSGGGASEEVEEQGGGEAVMEFAPSQFDPRQNEAKSNAPLFVGHAHKANLQAGAMSILQHSQAMANEQSYSMPPPSYAAPQPHPGWQKAQPAPAPAGGGLGRSNTFTHMLGFNPNKAKRGQPHTDHMAKAPEPELRPPHPPPGMTASPDNMVSGVSSLHELMGQGALPPPPPQPQSDDPFKPGYMQYTHSALRKRHPTSKDIDSALSPRDRPIRRSQTLNSIDFQALDQTPPQPTEKPSKIPRPRSTSRSSKTGSSRGRGRKKKGGILRNASLPVSKPRKNSAPGPRFAKRGSTRRGRRYR